MRKPWAASGLYPDILINNLSLPVAFAAAVENKLPDNAKTALATA